MITKFIERLFESERDREKRMVDEWLADSVSLQEIERKQRMINRGEAPWQVYTNQNLKGWV
jgi:hypothetical protein